MYLRKNILALILIALSFLFGVCAILVDPNSLIRIVMYILALFLIIVAVNFLIKSKEYLGKDKANLIIQSICLIIASIAIIFIPGDVIRIIIGVIFILYPLIYMFTVNNKFKQFKKDLPKYIIGLLLILSLDKLLKLFMIIIGSLLILFGFYLIIMLIINRNNKDQPNIIVKLAFKLFFKKERINTWE